MRLHPDLIEALNGDLLMMGESGGVVGISPVGGGCINQAARVETRHKNYFLKWNPNPLPGMFAAESAGLCLLVEAQAIRVPEVHSFRDISDGISYIFMEWISPAQRGARFDQGLLGTQLALLHRNNSPGGDFGLDHDNYIGSNPQKNGWEGDWKTFFRKNRLQPQIEMAVRKGMASGDRLRKLRYIATHLSHWLALDKCRPSLVHGDLWGGNVIAESNGEPILIDPAVYYGDREVDLAFTELFGGFSSYFYDAYQEEWPLDHGYSERRDIYNLYHLLNHLNLFGSSYGHQIDTLLNHYAP